MHVAIAFGNFGAGSERGERRKGGGLTLPCIVCPTARTNSENDSPVGLTLMGSDRAQVWSSTSKYIKEVRPSVPLTHFPKGVRLSPPAEILRTENREGGFLKEELEERKKADLLNGGCAKTAKHSRTDGRTGDRWGGMDRRHKGTCADRGEGEGQI